MQDVLRRPTSTADFSMMLGGPLYQLQLWAHVVRPPLDLLTRRMLVISIFAWAPMLALSIIVGRAWGGVKVPFLSDVDVQVRFLLSLPLLILAEWVVHQRFRPLVLQFVDRNIITSENRERFEDIVQSSFRLRNSILAEVILIVIVATLGPISWRYQAAINSSTWYADVSASGMKLTLPGYFYLFIALPLFQFILLRWFFRLLLWYRFLWKVSRLKLNLIPTHPDGAGGLGFLSATAHAMAPLLVAQSALLAGLIANRIFHQDAKLMAFKVEILALVVILLLQAVAPLLVFAPQLAACQRLGNRDYGVLASRYTAEFHQKWIAPRETMTATTTTATMTTSEIAARPDDLLGSADIQSLADLANSFAVIRSMSIVPFNKTTIIRLAIVTLLPILPLTLTVVPFDQMIDHLLRVVL